jgi:hypothetical protein
MARKSGKKALYEVIGKSRLPSLAGGEQAGQGPVEKPVADEPSVETPAVEKPAVTTWPKKPTIVQINAGRIEFSLPYQVAIALLLGVVLVLLVVYRLGQMSYATAPAEGGLDAREARDAETGKAPAVDSYDTSPPPSRAETTHPAEPGGKNVIVIVEYDKKRDLIPVQEHYREYGIETEIVLRPNGRYFLWTKERYDAVDPRSRCEADKQKIITVGAKYKAERGYERFGTPPFDDAYPKKVD